MRVLVTGITGFIGHHVLDWLLRNTDMEVVGLCRLSYAGNLGRVAELESVRRNPNRVSYVWHDLRAPLTEGVHARIGRVDFVIHIAAETHVDRSLVDATIFAQSNVVGTTNLLEYLRRHQPGLRKVVSMGTDEYYGPAPEGVCFREGDPPRPSNPYSASKVGQWAMEYAFAHAHGLPICWAFAMNAYAPRQHPEKFIPRTVRAMLRGEEVVLHGRSRQDLASRCWVYCEDLASALEWLLWHGRPKEVYHVVGEERTVWEIADIIAQEVTGQPLERYPRVRILDYHRARPGHDRRYALDGSKLRALGWSPRWPLETTLRRTVRWMVEHPQWLEG